MDSEKRNYFVTFWCDLGEDDGSGASIWEEYQKAVFRAFPGEKALVSRQMELDPFQIWWGELAMLPLNAAAYFMENPNKIPEKAVHRYQMAFFLGMKLPPIKGDYIAVLAMGPFDLTTFDKISKTLKGVEFPDSHLAMLMGDIGEDDGSFIDVRRELRHIFDVEDQLALFYTGDYPVGTLALENLGYTVERHPNNLY